jgi:hypothetical protein
LNKDGLVGGKLVSQEDHEKVMATKLKKAKATAKAKAEAEAKAEAAAKAEAKAEAKAAKK